MSLGLAELSCNPLDKKEGMLTQHWYPFLAFRLRKERFPGIWNFPRRGKRLGCWSQPGELAALKEISQF